MNEFKQHQFVIDPGNAINTFVLPFVFTDKVKEAVESIWKNHSPLEHRLILIDNSSEEFEDRKWLEENSHLYIRSYRNLGPALAFNLGIEMVKTEYVTIFSDDARLIYKVWFENAIKNFSASDTIISLNSIHPQDAFDGYFYDPDHDYTNGDYIKLDQLYGGFSKGFGLACAIARKETWIKSGLFNEEKYIYYIDGDFAAQAEKNQVDCYYGGVVFHYGDASHMGKLVEENKYQQTGMLNGRVIL